MSPFQHGEVFVLDDGSETDLDLGHYERFIDVNMTTANSNTAGQIYYEVINRERRGEYLGATIQVIPHITDEIKRRIVNVNRNSDFDVVISEIGGTVGDIEGLPFLEAIRQFCIEVGRGNFINIHLTLVPYLELSGEIKTKPTQHSVMRLREIGIQPDILLCRTKLPLTDEVRKKIALFCNVPQDAVVEALDAETIYDIPLIFDRQKLGEKVTDLLELEDREPDYKHLNEFVTRVKNPSCVLTIGVCGKYTTLHDAYKSIIEAFVHAGVENDVRVEIKWLDAEDLESMSTTPREFLSNVHGLLIPGGFGDRGVEGKILATQYARENKLPFFGICLGLQCAVIEFARNVCKLDGANSTEFDSDTPYPVIDLMEDQKRISKKGGTMRLGSYSAELGENTKAFQAYGKKEINERHRHRYEFNNDYRDSLESKGMIISAANRDLDLVEMVELMDNPWFLCCQFHPELKSRVGKAHPLFREFIRAALKYSKAKETDTVD